MKKLRTNFYLRGDKTNQNGETAIYGKIFVGVDLATYATSKYIDRERWIKTCMLRNPLRVGTEISLKQYLQSLSSSIETKYLELVQSGKNVTASELKAYCFSSVEKKITLSEVVNVHNTYFEKQVTKGDRSEGPLEKYKRMRDVLT